MSDLLNQLILQADAEVAKAKSTKQIDYLLLDGSGSMSGRWYESLHALDHYASGLKAQEVQTKVIMATFSSGNNFNNIEYNIVRSGAATDWSALRSEPPILPGGGTPLFDAINVMVRELREENPEKCSILIVTDGEENGSQLTTEDQARELLNWCRNRGWQVTFIGADFNNSRLAKTLGADTATAIGAPTKRLTDITSELAKKRGYYHTHGTPMNFTDAEKAQFGGYLSDHTNGAK